MSALVEAAATLLPVALGLAFGMLLGAAVPPSKAGLPALVWIPVLTVASTPVLLTAWRFLRPRLLALALLLDMDGFFSGTQPGRYGALLRSGNAVPAAMQLDQAPTHTTLVDGDEQPIGDYVIDLVTALTQHDRRTRGHCERVRTYSHLLAEQLGMDQLAANRVAWGGLLHDIGKLAVPSELLQAPRSLTETEFDLLKQHSDAGDQLMAPLKDWLGPAVHAARDHHRDLDGSGYPHLPGVAVTLEGRIVAVADAFDVMTARRVYKQPVGVTEALAELRRCSGTQFDANVVSAMVALHASGRVKHGGKLSVLSSVVGQLLTGDRDRTVAAIATVAAWVVGSVAIAGAVTASPDEVASKIVDSSSVTDGAVVALPAAPTSTPTSTPTPTTTSIAVDAPAGAGAGSDGGAGASGSNGGAGASGSNGETDADQQTSTEDESDQSTDSTAASSVSSADVTPSPTSTPAAPATTTSLQPTATPVASTTPTVSPTPPSSPTATATPAESTQAPITISLAQIPPPTPTATATATTAPTPTATATATTAPTPTATATATTAPTPTATATAATPLIANGFSFDADRNTTYFLDLAALSSDPNGGAVTWSVDNPTDPRITISLSQAIVTIEIDPTTPVGTVASFGYAITDGVETLRATVTMTVI